MNSPFPRWPALLGATLFSILLAATAVRSPANNFDLIGYVASVYAQQTEDPIRLHHLTYADIEQSIPHKDFTILTETPGYIATVHNDAEALRQQIPFYAIRHAYVQLISSATSLDISVTKATFLISAIFAGCSVFLTFMLFSHFKVSLYLIPFIAFPLGLREVGSLA